MNPHAAEMLVEQIAPRIRSLLGNSVAQVGSEDIDELAQDGIAVAATLLTSAQARGKTVSAGTISYYAAKIVRQGRRSTGQSTTDVMHPATQIAGRSRMVSLDEPLGTEAESEDALCLHDMLAARSADPGHEAAKRLDWQPLVAALDAKAREVLLCLVEGGELTSLVPKLKRSRSSLQSDKARLACLVREHLGQDILQQVQESPRWVINVTAKRERLACRIENQTA
ncbi:MAG: hypothetical protein ACREIC_32140 [Limisphaerales bacterium]